MASLLNRLAKLEQSHKSKAKPKQILIVKGDKSIPLEDYNSNEWLIYRPMRIGYT